MYQISFSTRSIRSHISERIKRAHCYRTKIKPYSCNTQKPLERPSPDRRRPRGTATLKTDFPALRKRAKSARNAHKPNTCGALALRPKRSGFRAVKIKRILRR